MNVLTLKIPEELDAALLAASRSRGLSKSAVVREALEQSLSRHADEAATSQRWLARWRGSLNEHAVHASKRTRGAAQPKSVPAQTAPDERLAHLLAKHLR